MLALEGARARDARAPGGGGPPEMGERPDDEEEGEVGEVGDVMLDAVDIDRAVDTRIRPGPVLVRMAGNGCLD